MALDDDPEATARVKSDATTPVPLRLTACGLLEALSAKFIVALSLPAIEGLNVTPTTHVPFGATVWLLHASDTMAKSAAFVPEIVTAPAPNVRLPEPELVTVRVCAVLRVPSTTLPI